MNNKKPLFIVFEGIDKSGKDTQADLLFKYFKCNLAQKVVFTFEPTKSNIFGKLIHLMLKKHIKIKPIIFQKMYYYDRYWHVRQIKKWLKQGYHVICCRYFFSTIAYGYGAGVDPEKIIKWHEKIPLPNVVFFLSLKPTEAIERLKKQGVNGELFEKENFLKKVAEGYIFCQEKYSNLWQTIPASADMVNIFTNIRSVLHSNNW